MFLAEKDILGIGVAGEPQEELETCFAEYVALFARETAQTLQEVLDTLRLMYNGYRFSEKDVQVYNPFSVLSALQEQAFRNNWFDTGTPIIKDVESELHRSCQPKPLNVVITNLCKDSKVGICAHFRAFFAVCINGPVLLGKNCASGRWLFVSASAEMTA